MQHGLLALAIALILAIVAALFAPAYVDWNEWRATFERQASELAGTSVQIRGPIEATILPTPAFVLRDVRIGDPENSTGIHAGEVQGTLSLGSLLKGTFEAEDFALVRPTIRIALEEGGRIVLPGSGAKGSDALAISRFAISNGSLTIDDRAAGAMTFLDGISAIGEMHSRTGPMRLDAAMRKDGRRWSLSASTGVFGAEGARTRLMLERPDDGASLDADGTLAFAAGTPRFNGRINLAHARTGLPWKIAAQANTRGDLVTFESFEFTAGNEFPLELAGNAQFLARRGGAIEGAFNAKRLDLDRAFGVKPGEGLAAVLAPLREILERGGELPLKGKLAFTVDLVAANGAQMRDVRGAIGLRDGFIGLDSLEAKLPGRAALTTSGHGGSGYFRGDMKLEAEDPVALARWALGPDKVALPEDTGRSGVAGFVDWSPGKLSVDRLDLTLGEAKLRGSLSLAQDGQRPAWKASLSAESIDLDPLAPFAEALWSGSKDSDLSLQMQGRSLRVLGKNLPSLLANVTRNADGVAVESLNAADFDGLTLRAKGRISKSDPQARLELALEATRPGGLVTLVRHFGGADSGLVAQHALKAAMPLSLSGFAAIQDEGRFAASAAGTSADMPVNLSVRTDGSGVLTHAKLNMASREAGRLVSLFGLSPGLPAPGDGKLELEILAKKANAFPLHGNLSVPGAEFSATGEIAAKDGRLEPRLQLKLDAADLRPSLAAASRAGEGAVAAKGSASLVRSGEGLAFDNLALDIGGTRMQGRLVLNEIEKPAFSGRLSLDRLQLADLFALLAGRASDGKSFWPALKPGAAPLAGTSGSVEMEVGTLGFGGAHVANAAKFSLRLGETAEIANFTADYAGGKLAGDARIGGGKALSFDGRATLNGFELARMLAPGTGKAPARGRGNLQLSLSGSGGTPAALAANLSGQGTLSLDHLEIDTLDPSTITTVVSASEKHMPRDEGHLIQGVNTMLARAPLALPRLEAALVAANGTLRTGKAITKAGEVEVTAEASADLARLQVDGSIELETAGRTTARPGLTVRWRGPLGEPVRSVDVSALSTAINLRAMEREMKRLEQRERTALPFPAAPAREAQNGSSGEDVTGLAAAKLPKRAPLPPARVQ